MSDWLLDAAVRVAFTREALATHPSDDELLASAKPRRDGSWMLPDMVRRDELSGAGIERVRDALALVPSELDAEDPRQRLLRRLVTDTGPALDEWTLEELRVGSSVVRWLSGVEELMLPSEDAIRSTYAHESWLAPLRASVERFRGRAQALAELRRHVTQVDGSITKVVTGVGGSGKTALMAKLVVELVEAEIKVAYLDLDRADLDLSGRRSGTTVDVTSVDHRPAMLAAEIARQVAILAGRGSASWLRTASDHREGWMRGGPFADELASLLRGLGGGPLVVVIDTFEEAQYQRDQGGVQAVITLIESLRHAWPKLRVIVGGRVAIDELHEADTLPLSDLEPADAIAVLRGAGAERLSNAELADVARVIGGNPLWLTIAGQAIAASPEAYAELGKLRGEAAAGFFFRRILGHLHGVEHLELVAPALHLRVLRPQLLCDIVAPELGTELSVAAAEQHLAALAREVAFVTRRDDETRHREEVRALTLEWLATETTRWNRMHMRASTWWWRHARAAAEQAEAVYHTLAAWDGVTALPWPAWSEGWNRHLVSAMLEPTFPLASRALLRANGVGHGGLVHRRSSPLDAARRAAAKRQWDEVDAALAEADLDAAGTLLLAQARHELGRPGALELARAARRSALGDDAVATEAALTEAGWLVEQGLIEEAVAVLDEAFALARAPLDRLRLLDARHGMRSSNRDEAQVVRVLDETGVDLVGTDPPLLRRLLRWVEHEPLLLEGLRVLGLHGLDDAALLALGEALATADEARGFAAGLAGDATVDWRWLSRWLEDELTVAEIRGVVRAIDEGVEFEIDWSRPLTVVAERVARALQRRGATGEKLRHVLRATKPRLVHEVDSIWRLASLRQHPEEMARVIDKLRSWDGRLHPAVAAALRDVLASAREGAAPDGLQELIKVLEVALPTARHRRRAAHVIGIARPEDVARDVRALVGAADAGGSLDALVSSIGREEPAFQPQLEAAWLSVLVDRLEWLTGDDRRHALEGIMAQLTELHAAGHPIPPRALEGLRAAGYDEEIRVVLDSASLPVSAGEDVQVLAAASVSGTSESA